MTQEAKKDEPGFIWNWAADIGSGNQLSISGNFPKGMSQNEMNAEVDKVRAVFNRQQAKSAARNLEEEIDRLAAQKRQVLDTLTKIDNKSDTKGSLSTAERSQRDTVLTNIESLSTNIDSKQKLLQKLNNESK